MCCGRDARHPSQSVLCGAPGRGPRDRKPRGLGGRPGRATPSPGPSPSRAAAMGLDFRPPFLKEAPQGGGGDQPGTGKTSDVTWLRPGSSRDHGQPSLSSSWEGAPHPGNRAAPGWGPLLPTVFPPPSPQRLSSEWPRPRKGPAPHGGPHAPPRVPWLWVAESWAPQQAGQPAVVDGGVSS